MDRCWRPTTHYGRTVNYKVGNPLR